jgi:hypothetical protein
VVNGRHVHQCQPCTHHKAGYFRATSNALTGIVASATASTSIKRMKVELDRSGCFILAADAAPVRQTLERDYSPTNSRDASLFCRSLAELRRFEKQGSTVLFGHDEAQWDTLKKGAVAYD